MHKMLIATLLLAGTIVNSQANSVTAAQMPIKKVSLFSSGVGFFEHYGQLENSAKISLFFKKENMDDILKSLNVYDAQTSAPFISYQSEETLAKTLKNIKADISGNPSIEQILQSLKGAEIEILLPEKIRGKIIGTQMRENAKNGVSINESFLSLMVGGEIKLVAMNDIKSYRFTDQKISKELSKALDFVFNSHGNDMVNLQIYLPSKKKRNVALSYVAQSPVWKATYRLDVSDKKADLQGWAIVDNVGNADWKDVELSLIVGRPISFSQPFYSPYYIARPTLPLQIAGFAEALTHESGYSVNAQETAVADIERKDGVVFKDMILARSPARAEVGAADILSNYNDADAKNAGEQFVFTLKNKITLNRQQSAMVPLIQNKITAKKVSVFQAQKIGLNQSSNPSLAIELENDSGTKLPAGPVTVYDDKTYVGDALLEFLPQNEKRIISYGDDLSVSGAINSSFSSYVDSVKINKGVFTINSKRVFEKTYIFKNSDNRKKNFILEHPITDGTKLTQPSKYSEKTASLYRFAFALPSNKELTYNIKEESPYHQQVVLSSCDYPTLLAYSSNSEFSEKAKKALKKAADMVSDISSKNGTISALMTELVNKQNEQQRIRDNIGAVGKDSQQGKEYIAKLVSLDNEIEKLNANIKNADKEFVKAKEAYSAFLNSIDI